jgi:uncharacterized damage-inducible protein DinB
MLKEIEGYLSILTDLRAQVKKGLEGLPTEALDWRPTKGQGDLATNSMVSIAIHLAGSETFWMKEIIGGRPIHRDREAEFIARGFGESELQAKLDAAGKVTVEFLSSLSPAQLDESRTFRDRKVTVRWAVLHVIEHMATHLGHIQLTRQLWMAQKENQPRS